MFITIEDIISFILRLIGTATVMLGLCVISSEGFADFLIKLF